MLTSASSTDERRLIVGGAESTPFRYSYMASLSTSGEHDCGGTLIAPDIILTAAHCISSKTGGGEVRLGRHNLSDTSVDNESFSWESARTHPRYFSHSNVIGTVDVDPYDIALLKINGTSQQTVVPINRDATVPSPGEQLLALGWGTTSVENPQTFSNILRETLLDYIPNDVCIEATGTSSSGFMVDYEREIIDVSLCAADFSGSDACAGDSGGPLLIDGVQVGIISASFGCVHPTLPGLNVRISHVHNWIDEAVCELSAAPPGDFGCSIEPAQEQLEDPTELTRPFLTVVIQLDEFPTETGYSLEGLFLDGSRLVAAVYPGVFGPEMANRLVTNKVYLLDAGAQPDKYRFTMTDNEHDGLIPGFYQVWLGDEEEGIMLFEGGNFFLEDVHTFDNPLSATSNGLNKIPARKRWVMFLIFAASISS